MNLASLSSKIKIIPNILFRELEGEAVLLNSETGIYFGLDPAGTDIWHRMQKEKNLGEVLKSLLEDYEADPKTCREDLLRFTSHLQKNGLIEVHE